MKNMLLKAIRSTRCLQVIFTILVTAKSYATPAFTDINVLSVDDWAAVRNDARHFVQRESPPNTLPFSKSRESMSSRKVIAHYFPPFPLSIDNMPFQTDYYSEHYLKSLGENGKYRAQGGFLRQRPLPTRVWPARRATQTNLAIEIFRAEAIGIDAFGFNLLGLEKGPFWSTAIALLDTAAHVSKNFRIVPEPDMSALKDVTVGELVDALAVFFNHPASFHLPDGRLLVIPFLAEARPPTFWKEVLHQMKERNMPIALIPTVLDVSALPSFIPFSYGITFWGGRDAASAQHQLDLVENLRLQSPIVAMMPVAPQDFRPKESTAWEARNTEAFRYQWNAANRSNAEYVHLLTWNDYSESTEIAPSTGTQFVFSDLCAYFVEEFKKRRRPVILRDALYIVHRRQIFTPTAKRGNPIRQVGTTSFVNDVEVIAFLTKPAILEIQIGDRITKHQVSSGLQAIRVPAIPGKVRTTLIRNGRPHLKKVSDWHIDPAPTKHDALYVGTSTARTFIRSSDPE